MPKIVQKNDSVLRQTAREVEPGEFGTPELEQIIADMKTALESQPDGVAIAAPQIGQPLRIFVVSSRAWRYVKGTDSEPDKVFINPVITRQSKSKQKMEEGCLSVRWWYGHVTRSLKTRVEAYDESGRKFTYNGSGLISQIFQHEIDHLNGTLFIDKATDLRQDPPPPQEDA